MEEAQPPKTKSPQYAMAVIALLIMALGAGLLSLSKRHQKLGSPGVKLTPASATQAQSIELPERVLSYTSSVVPASKLEIDTLPKDTTLARRLYVAPDGFQLMMTVVLMGTDRTSIHKPEYCLTAQGWTIARQEFTNIPVARPHPYQLPVRKFSTTIRAEDPSGKAVTWNGFYVFWFVCENRLTSSHFARLGWITRELLLRGTLPRWAYVSCLATCQPGKEEAAYQRVVEFLSAAVPEFQTATLPPSVADVGPGASDLDVAYFGRLGFDEKRGADATGTALLSAGGETD